jgi:hypothetical protein
MTQEREFVVCAVLIGIGGTVVLDIWNALLKRLFGVPSLSMGMLGRWFGHFPRGRFMHAGIAKAAPVPGERAIGWIAHYAIGITWAALLLAVWGLDWARRPTLVPPVIVGLVTVAAPFFIMQPAMGLGIAASKTPSPNAARLKSIASHTVYALGLYGSAWLAALLVRPESGEERFHRGASQRGHEAEQGGRLRARSLARCSRTTRVAEPRGRVLSWE